MPEDTFGDVAELDRTRAALQLARSALTESLEAQDFLTSVLNASKDCIKVLNPNGDLVFMNNGGQRVMEIDDFEAVKGQPWLGFWEGDGRAGAAKALKRAQAGGSGWFTGSACTAKGNEKYWDVTVTHLPGGNILSISRDITAERDALAHREMLARELGHRVKNCLSIAQAIGRQTFKTAEPDKLNNFSGRLAALGNAQSLLLQTGWESVTVSEVVATTLEPLCPANSCEIDGPEVLLDARRGLTLGLALYELGTNALKYGALSVPGGKVSVKWSLDDGLFQLDWIERGGPPVSPPAAPGFGTRLITTNLRSDFAGVVNLNYLPSGVELSLTAPL